MANNKRDIILSQVKMKSAERPAFKPSKASMVSGPNFPGLYLNAKQLPELSGKKVGDEMTLVIQCCITGISAHMRGGKPDEKCENFDLSIKKIGVANQNPEKS